MWHLVNKSQKKQVEQFVIHLYNRVHYFVIYFYFVFVLVKMKVTVWLLNTLNALSCQWDIWCTNTLQKM